MTASLEERLLPILVMLAASTISALIPLYALRRRRLNFQRDIAFIFFWFQSWIYLHLVPSLNCMFPASAFAFPSHLADFRVIQFTAEQVDLYALFQVLFVLLFYIPMGYVYGRHISREHSECRFVSAISFPPLLILAALYLFFGIIYFSVAVRTGMINAYTMNVDAIMGLARVDRFVLKLYHLSASFLMCVVLLSFFEYQGRSLIKRLFLFMVILAGVACTLSAYMISSRGAVLFAVLGIVTAAGLRGHIKRIDPRKIALASLIIIFGVYIFVTVPKMRAVVLEPDATRADIVKTLNPFGEAAIVPPDFGVRLDGVELMVLATPSLFDQGTVPFSWYLISLASPVLPLFPEWEKELKIVRDVADFKYLYITSHTPVSTRDYVAVSLTELFMILGPLGFLVAGIFFGWALRRVSSLIQKGGARTLIGIYFLFWIMSFEAPIANAWTGWIRACPGLLIALFFNPWRLIMQGKAVPQSEQNL
jgi:hypothetical protein